VATGIKPARLAGMIFDFYGSYRYERVHPLQSGVLRRKVRTQRRHGMALENPLVFYPRRAWEFLRTYVPGLLYFLRLTRVRKRIQRDPASKTYTDVAIAPVVDGDEAGFEMFGVTEAARSAVDKAKRREAVIARARGKGHGELDIPVKVAGG